MRLRNESLSDTLMAIISDDAASENEKLLARRALSRIGDSGPKTVSSVRISRSDRETLSGDDELVSAKRYAFASIVSTSVPVFMISSEGQIWLEGDASVVGHVYDILMIAEIESRRERSRGRSFAVFREILSMAFSEGEIVDVSRIAEVRRLLLLTADSSYGHPMKTGGRDDAVGRRTASSVLSFIGGR